MDADSIHTLTTANHLVLADVLDSLDAQQWRTPTLCAGWSAQEMAAHLVQPMLVGFGRVFLVSLRYRGDLDRTVDRVTRPAEALAMAVTGRPAALGDLRGPGVPILAARPRS